MERKHSYFRIRLGRKHAFAQQCREESWVGIGEISRDLTNELPETWKEFNTSFIPVWMEEHPGVAKAVAGLVCASVHIICKEIQQNDIVLCPDGKGNFWLGEVTGDYTYVPSETLCHRRSVQWLPREPIAASEISDELLRIINSATFASGIDIHAEEMDRLLGDAVAPELTARDPDVEDPSVFALERHLEDFLVTNWDQTELGKTHSLLEDDGEIVGLQYPTDVGAIDLLAVSKDEKELLVIELKKGRTSDVVIGQTLRYMGYVMGELAKPDQSVRGCIIALEDDPKLRYAMKATNNVDFYRYRVDFHLIKKSGTDPIKPSVTSAGV